MKQSTVLLLIAAGVGIIVVRSRNGTVVEAQEPKTRAQIAKTLAAAGQPTASTLDAGSSAERRRVQDIVNGVAGPVIVPNYLAASPAYRRRILDMFN